MSLDVHIQSTKSLSAQTVMLQLIWGWLISVVTQPWLADWHTTRKLIQAKLSRCFFLWTRSCQNISFYTFAFFIQISKCHTPWTVNITPPPPRPPTISSNPEYSRTRYFSAYPYATSYFFLFLRNAQKFSLSICNFLYIPDTDGKSIWYGVRSVRCSTWWARRRGYVLAKGDVKSDHYTKHKS